MPYVSNEDLPVPVRQHLPEQAKDISRARFSMPGGAGRMLGLLVIIMAFTGVACAPAANPLEDTAAAFRCCTAWGGTSAGFWLGLWHGAIAPVTLVVSLFSSDVGIYEVHNNGGWYHVGFLFGLTMSIGGGAGGRSYYRTGWRRGSRRGA